jgi:hypothetical protein
MADLQFDNQSTPSTPSAGKSLVFVDATTKRLAHRDDGGTDRGSPLSKAASVGQQTGIASDTYLTSSGILIPSAGFQVGQYYQWRIGIQKTAAGTAAIVATIRIGTAQTTADTSRLVLTQTVAQAATAAGTILEITALVRTVSASGVIVGCMAPVGGSLAFGSGIQAVSSTFDNTAIAGNYVGISLNGGASASYTIDSVVGWMIS